MQINSSAQFNANTLKAGHEVLSYFILAKALQNKKVRLKPHSETSIKDGRIIKNNMGYHVILFK